MNKITKEEIVKAIKDAVVSIEELQSLLKLPSKQDKDNVGWIHLLLCSKDHSESQCKYYTEERLENTWELPDHEYWLNYYNTYRKSFVKELSADVVTKELRLVTHIMEAIKELDYTPGLLFTYVHNINKAINKE